MVGEVYGYKISSGREYDFGDKKVDYFDNGFHSLINFELKDDANQDYETIFSKYNDLLFTELEGKSVVNYLTSHDDIDSFDKERKTLIMPQMYCCLPRCLPNLLWGRIRT